MKWYEQTFVSRRDWILENLSLLGLSGNEFMVVMCIDFMNQHGHPVTIETISRKTGFSDEETNEIMSTLVTKNYLRIRAVNGSVSMILDGLFETDTAREKNLMDSSLFDLFESEMKRTLSSIEMERISQWNRMYDKNTIIMALREASARQKVSLNYIEKILLNGNQ